jgi:hypothetical protein
VHNYFVFNNFTFNVTQCLINDNKCIVCNDNKSTFFQASYRRERLKVIDSEKGKKTKLTKWFAYHAMMFLEDHYKPRGSRNNSEVNKHTFTV